MDMFTRFLKNRARYRHPFSSEVTSYLSDAFQLDVLTAHVLYNCLDGLKEGDPRFDFILDDLDVAAWRLRTSSETPWGLKVVYFPGPGEEISEEDQARLDSYNSGLIVIIKA